MRKVILFVAIAIFFVKANAQPPGGQLDFDNATCFNMEVIVYAVDNTQTVVGQTQAIAIPAMSGTIHYNTDPTKPPIPWQGGSAPGGQWTWGYATVTVTGGCTTGGAGTVCPFVGTATAGVCCGYNTPACYDNTTGCVMSGCLPASASMVMFGIIATEHAGIVINPQ